MKCNCFFILICSFLCSCDNASDEFVESEELNPWIYTKDFTASFTSKSQEARAYRADLCIDHNDAYPFENLYVKYTIISDRDTIRSGIKSFMLQNEIGQWIGKQERNERYHSMHVLDDSIKESYSNLHVVISQYSRMDTLVGIEQISIGLIPI